MKKLTLTLIISLYLVSCKKDEIPVDCKCGVITNVKTFKTSDLVIYTIKNDCSSSEKESIGNLASDTIHHVGNAVCTTESW